MEIVADTKSNIRKLMLAGVATILLSWLAEATLDSILYPSSNFLQHLFLPAPRVILARLLFSATQMVIIIYALVAMQRSKRLEQELINSVATAYDEKAKAEAIIAAMGDAVSIQDTNLKVLYQNEAHRRMMGDQAGRYCYSAYQHKDEVCPGCHLLLSFQDGQIHRRETSTSKPSGTTYVEITSSPLRDKSGNIVAGIELVRDITDRKLAEIRLKSQLTAIESSIDGIAILDKNGKFTFMNTAHARIYGADSPAFFIGKNWQVLYDEREADNLRREMMPILQRDGFWRGEATGRRCDGTSFPQEISLSLMDDGILTCVVRDITERKTADEEIQQLNTYLHQQAEELAATNKELESFSYTLSHDIHTPLSRIYVAAQGLDEMYADKLDETGRYLLRSICEGSEQMEELINAMLVLAKINREELKYMEVDLSRLGRDIGTELRTLEPERQVEFVVQPVMTCTGDPNLLRVAVNNLLDNAWKYTRKTAAPRVEFGMTDRADKQEFFVRDNGAGFDMARADELFKPFKRLHRSDDYAGNGIGLATVKRIIERHGGEISGFSELDKGATFYFTIGVIAETAQPLPAATEENLAAPPLT